jgi:hypothetical protein
MPLFLTTKTQRYVGYLIDFHPDPIINSGLNEVTFLAHCYAFRCYFPIYAQIFRVPSHLPIL